MKAEKEIWQVMSGGSVYQADLPTLKQWIVEGVVLPEDKVRKGNLTWIEAGRAPMLRTAFTGEWQPAPSASQAQTQQPAEPVEPISPVGFVAPPSQTAGEAAPFLLAVPAEPEETPALSDACQFHPDQPPTFACRSCAATFCRACTRRVENSFSIALCTLCGNFLYPFKELAERRALHEYQQTGFGLADFGRALSEPLRHLPSLIGGSLLYALLLLSGARGYLLASALMFGCVSLVIGRVGYGKLDRDFLPDFASFSIWDDVLVPCFLGLGITIVTLGPTLLLVAALLFGLFGGAQAKLSPLSPEEIRALQEQVEKEGPLTPEEMRALAGGGTAEQEAIIEKKINSMRSPAQAAKQLEESKRQESTAVMVFRQLWASPVLILLLGLLAIGWAVFYHPMALLVAGWTADFKSVVNPLIGLDTLRFMGLATYAKAFGIYLAVHFASLVISLIVAIVTAPFDMPFVGNLPATFVDGVVTFYANLVIAYALGLALFKSADRLNIDIG